MKEYLEYLRVVKKRSERTLYQYHSILKEFSKFEPVTPETWREYLHSISMNSPATQRNKLVVVKNYLNWKVDRGMMNVENRFWNEAEPPKHHVLPKAIEIEEVRKIIEICDHPMYKAIFKILANTGMRISELINLEKEDISLNDSARIRIKGKGNKERIINVTKDLIEELINSGFFEKKPSVRSIQRAVRRYARKAGIKKKVTPHVFRHSFAVALIERGVPLNKIQALLGHANISTTSIYLKIASEGIEIPKIV
ncbi:tyrosine-type recombinase/integrase [Thermotoga sp. KOL6]|uniref:tyrosine-type recombinase/integrase n=1 Tax=Thermotoga sp. KOL6 TaxID=126741 RepID=UPI000C782AD4|nr:tyrosine-type recombinase/integrase [Thermotoga sp. KOL6]PLV59754.1 integrase [Thermotoga sp. KOL6]